MTELILLKKDVMKDNVWFCYSSGDENIIFKVFHVPKNATAGSVVIASSAAMLTNTGNPRIFDFEKFKDE